MSHHSAIEQRLRDCGLRPTPQRLEIGAVLLGSPRHMSAEQIISELRAAGSAISKATVYNTLNIFSRHGIAREVAVDPGRLVYDSTTGPHHHFYNVDTGELIDIPPAALHVEGLPELPAGTEQQGVEVIIRVRNRS